MLKVEGAIDKAHAKKFVNTPIWRYCAARQEFLDCATLETSGKSNRTDFIATDIS